MLNHSKKFFSPRQMKIPLIGLLVVFGIVAADRAKPVLSHLLEQIPTSTAPVTESQASLKTSNYGTKATNFPKKDGVYLYGQSPKVDQNGQGYIVFEKRQNKVMGALYMPQSEYSCFDGTLNSSGQLAMTVAGYPGDGSVATNVGKNTRSKAVKVGTAPMPTEDELNTYGYSVKLQDYHRFKSVNVKYRLIVEKCKRNYQQ